MLTEGQGRALAVKLEGALDKLSVGEIDAALLVIARDVVVPATQSEDDATERDEN